MKQAVNRATTQPRTVAVYARLVAVALSFMLVLPASHAAAQPVTSDSRIKTFVYNPNEVFSITTHYGYQSNIEFAQKETIETISVGDRVAWQIIPAGRRLFIRAMEENAKTNMTIVTNMRAYQFELRSSASNAVFGSESLTYVVRFFYPGEAMANGVNPVPAPAIAPPMLAAPVPQQTATRDLPPPMPVAAQTTAPTAPAPVAVAPLAPIPSINSSAKPVPVATPYAAPPAPAPQQQPVAAATPAPVQLQPAPPSDLNYRYTFSGPNDIAPTKIYDDGKTTFFKLPSTQVPKFAILTAAGTAIDVPARRTREGLIAVDVIAQSFRLKQGGREVLVYNEAGGGVN